MRDALSMLDQVRAACGDAPDDGAVAEAVGAIAPGAVARIAAALVRRDGASVLAELGALHARGQEMKRIAEELVRHLRNVVVAKLVPQVELDLPDTELHEVRAQAEAAAAPQLTRLFDLVQRAVADLKTSEQPRYALEVALLKACFLAPGADVGELIARLENLGGAAPAPGSGGGRPLTGGAPGCAAGSAAASTRPPGRSASAPASPAPAEPSRSRAPASPAPAEPSQPRAPAPAAAPPEASSGATADRWRALVAHVEQKGSGGALLVNALKQAVVVAFTEGEISLRLPPGLPYSTVEKRRPELVEIFGRFLGRPAKLTLGRGVASDSAPVAEGAGGQPQSLAELEQAEREVRSERVRAAARGHPNIQDAAKILEGEVTKIEEL